MIERAENNDQNLPDEQTPLPDGKLADMFFEGMANDFGYTVRTQPNEETMPEVIPGFFVWKPESPVEELTPEVIEDLVRGSEHPDAARLAWYELKKQREELKKRLERPWWKFW